MSAESAPRQRPVVALGVLALLISGITLGFSSCGGDEPPAFPDITVNEPAQDKIAAGATLSGGVRWLGKGPRNSELAMGADAYCKDAGAGKTSERLVVDAKGGMRDVLIHVTKGLEAYTFDWNREAAIIDQANCVYVPHVIAIRTNQPLTFRNSDITAHNVNTRSSGQGFNKTTPSKGSEFTWQFKSAELDIRTKCDVHPWMNAHIHVLDHPYFAVTDASGAWRFPRALPPGTYTVEALHPTEGKQSKELTIEAGKAPSPLEFRFSG